VEEVTCQYVVVNSGVRSVDDMTKQFEKDYLLPRGCDCGNSHSCWYGVVGKLSQNGGIPGHLFT
jgi:hypothetical protein